MGFPGKKTGVDCHFLLQGIFLTQGSNWHLLHLPALAGGFFTTQAEVQISALPHTSRVKSGKILCLSKPQFPQLQDGNKEGHVFKYRVVKERLV